jgi:hypothetical protein
MRWRRHRGKRFVRRKLQIPPKNALDSLAKIRHDLQQFPTRATCELAFVPQQQTEIIVLENLCQIVRIPVGSQLVETLEKVLACRTLTKEYLPEALTLPGNCACPCHCKYHFIQKGDNCKGALLHILGTETTPRSGRCNLGKSLLHTFEKIFRILHPLPAGMDPAKSGEDSFVQQGEAIQLANASAFALSRSLILRQMDLAGHQLLLPENLNSPGVLMLTLPPARSCKAGLSGV